MKQKLLFFTMLLFSVVLSAQWSNTVIPAQVQTSPDDDSSNNIYSGSIDYTFNNQSEVDALTYMTIRIRPITNVESKDPAVANTDFGILPDFKAYASTNGLTGTYTWNIDMPNDSALPSTAERQAGGTATYGYDTRFQTDGYLSTFVALEVLKSTETLATRDFQKNSLSAFYNSSKEALILTNNDVTGAYKVFDVTGRIILKGTISNEINVSSLKSGLFILATDKGSLKFVK